MSDGWIKLHRQLINNAIWLSEQFTDGQAWVDILLLTSHNKSSFKSRGIRVDVNPGECAYSEVALSNRWKWSRGKVRRFLKFLEQQKMIKLIQQKNKLTTIISVLNYEKYQSTDTTNNFLNDTSSGTTNGHQTDIIKNVKNKKNIDIEQIQKDFCDSLIPFSSEFDKNTLREFYEYWSEPNPSKTKIRYQTEKTWDTHRRLLRWVNMGFKKSEKEEKITYKSAEPVKKPDRW